MAGGQAKEPANEAALIEQTIRACRRRYGHRFWSVQTTRITAGRVGIPDRLICFDGIFHAWEFKNPRRPERPKPRQQQELAAIGRAGGRPAVILSVEQALQILTDQEQEHAQQRDRDQRGDTPTFFVSDP